MTLLLQTDLPNLLHRGKVRDTYRLSGDDLLLVATDRVSAFDVVLPAGIPDKGQLFFLFSVAQIKLPPFYQVDVSPCHHKTLSMIRGIPVVPGVGSSARNAGNPGLPVAACHISKTC